MRFGHNIGVPIWIMLICLSCSSDNLAGLETDRDYRPVWVLTEGYGDEHFYSVGVFGGTVGEGLPERVNGAQIDALNKLRVQLYAQAQNLFYTWSDNLTDYRQERISDQALEYLVADSVDYTLDRAYHVQSWTDPETKDMYVLLKVRLGDFVRMCQDGVSYLVAEEIPDHSREAHSEFDRLLSKLKRQRIRN